MKKAQGYSSIQRVSGNLHLEPLKTTYEFASLLAAQCPDTFGIGERKREGEKRKKKVINDNHSVNHNVSYPLHAWSFSRMDACMHGGSVEEGTIQSRPRKVWWKRRRRKLSCKSIRYPDQDQAVENRKIGGERNKTPKTSPAKMKVDRKQVQTPR